MKKISNILKCFTIIITSIFTTCYCKISTDAYAIGSSYALVEKISGRVLYAQNESIKLPMASTTKILTAITVINNFDIDKTVTVPKECEGVEGSSVYLKCGDKFTVIDLLYGLMLRSGNDCAETLAITLSGSISEFANLMNKTAKECGALNSNFVNPHGLHDDNHYTTALDLANITRHALLNQTFREIVGSKSYSTKEQASGESRYWVNKNKMLASYEGATGVKTGYTKKAGRCLVSSAIRNGMEVICVVLNEPNHYERSKKLLNDAFKDFKLVKLVDCSKFNYRLPNEDKTRYYDLKINEDFYYPIKNDEKITAEIELPNCLDGNVKNGQMVGKIKIYTSKQLIFFENIYTLIRN